jgi:hypothetical protein
MKHSTLISLLPVLCGSALVLGCPGNATESGTNGDTDTDSDSDDDDDDSDDDSDSVTLSTTDTLTTADPDTTETDPSDTLTTADPDTTDTESTDPSTSTDPTTDTDGTTTDDTDGTTTDTDGTTTETGTGECQVFDLDAIAHAGTVNMRARYQAGSPILSYDDADLEDLVRFDFYTAETGDFDLTVAPNDNIQTCEQCFYALTDIVPGKEQDVPTHIYYQSAGSVAVAADPQGGALDITTTGVRLVEVTFDMEGVPTPVEDGGCIDIVDGAITAIEPPKAWDCNPSYFSAADGCDCGCGVVDPDCDDATLDSCDFCANIGSCSADPCANNMDIDPEDNGVCL